MPKYSLTKKDAAYLVIEINNKDYRIPLAKTLKVKEVKKLFKYAEMDETSQVEFLTDFLGSYISPEIVEDMTVEDLFEIFSLWTKANTEAGGLTLGELSASRDSSTSTAGPSSMTS